MTISSAVPESPTFDIREIPFSCRGSWLNLSPVVALDTRKDAIHLVSHKNGMHGVLALQPQVAREPVDTEWHAEATLLTWSSTDDAVGGATVEAVFDRTEAVRLRGVGMGMRLADAAGGLTPFTGSYLFTDPVDGAAVFTSYETGRRYRVTSLTGSVEVVGDGALGVADRAVVLGGDGMPWEVAVQETTSASAPYSSDQDFDDVVATTRSAFATYLEAVAPWRNAAAPAAALAAYVLWSATVEPDGLTTRESVLMSKHWMDKLWSWDHCFNAIALAPGLTDNAIDQWLAPFDHQDSGGALPDSITHSEVLYNFVKPPIHGWALTRLRATAGRGLTHAELTAIHDRLAAWTQFWLRYRRRPDHLLPYYQHGNDSGWDNSTTFDRERVIEAPDLAAFLVLQLEVLADVADELGRPSTEWRQVRDLMLEALLDQLWTGEEFVASGALDGQPSSATSLLNLLPLILGDRLPESVRATMAERVEGHLTEWGLATEPVSSPQYEDDGYWRGPIWAPSTAIIEDGLRSSGFHELADTVSDRFRRLCERSGFAENFDARTGAGLRDRAYTWTASVYLMLAADHARRDTDA